MYFTHRFVQGGMFFYPLYAWQGQLAYYTNGSQYTAVSGRSSLIDDARDSDKLMLSWMCGGVHWTVARRILVYLKTNASREMERTLPLTVPKYELPFVPSQLNLSGKGRWFSLASYPGTSMPDTLVAATPPQRALPVIDRELLDAPVFRGAMRLTFGIDPWWIDSGKFDRMGSILRHTPFVGSPGSNPASVPMFPLFSTLSGLATEAEREQAVLNEWSVDRSSLTPIGDLEDKRFGTGKYHPVLPEADTQPFLIISDEDQVNHGYVTVIDVPMALNIIAATDLFTPAAGSTNSSVGGGRWAYNDLASMRYDMIALLLQGVDATGGWNGTKYDPLIWPFRPRRVRAAMQAITAVANGDLQSDRMYTAASGVVEPVPLRQITSELLHQSLWIHLPDQLESNDEVMMSEQASINIGVNSIPEIVATLSPNVTQIAGAERDTDSLLTNRTRRRSSNSALAVALAAAAVVAAAREDSIGRR